MVGLVLEGKAEISEKEWRSLDSHIQRYIDTAYQFVAENQQEWKLSNNAELEVTNHVLRVYIQDGSISKYVSDVLDLCKIQNSDGGWGNYRDETESMLRSTSFCVQMLLRANRVLNDSTVSDSVLRGLNYIASQQLDDGSWRDSTWHFLDAVSTSVGTLLFAVNESFEAARYQKILDKGMNFVLSQRDSRGLWHYKASGSPVTITAHLLQKVATYNPSDKLSIESLKSLLLLQSEAGDWDKGNTDHTCDAIRSMMLTSSRLKDQGLIQETFASSCRAIKWLISVSDEIGRGLGDRPMKPAHVERTCDGIDSMLKLRQFKDDYQQMIKFWS